MSQNELHDLLAKLRSERSGADIVDAEYQQRLDEIVESLEQQALYPDSFDQYSSLSEQVTGMLRDYEREHPTVKAILDGVHRVLLNFKA